MDSPRRRSRTFAVACCAVALLLTACGSDRSTPAADGTAACPVKPLNVVVTINVWGSVVDQLAGTCADVTTLVNNPSADPHDFEVTAQTSSTIAQGDILVMNGLGYDSWAARIVDSLGSQAPAVLNLGQTLGLSLGANPHIWYSPKYVDQAAAAITILLRQKLPAAATQFAGSARSFAAALRPYHALISSIRSAFAGTKVGATESLFDYLADATGLVITTPDAFRLAQANGTDPNVRSVATFRTQLMDGTDRVLILNTQTQGGVVNTIRDLAITTGTPVVGITETLTPENASFQDWQTRQLHTLAAALSGAKS